jgi:polysaccharide pyruvyl transferase WcaK-like protein
MKIGIITTHYALNYGAFLQALALQRTVSQLGHDCEIIDYRPKSSTFGRNYIRKSDSVPNFFRNVYALFSLNIYRKYISRRKKFDDTRNREMRSSERIYSSQKEILQNVEPYDVFICGSDQIWNIGLMYDPVFFLDFHGKYPSAKYVAYAPSVSMKKFSGEEEQLYSEHMKCFNAISVRESLGKELLSPLTEKEVKVVLDPVFLYGTKNWKDFAEIPKDFILQEPYIFCYYIGSNKIAQLTVDKLRSITGFRVVYCNVNLRDRFHSNICIRDASPQEFVGLIANASFICTNSFHATAFSLMFEKPFIVNLKNDAGDSRMEDLLSTVGLNDRFCDFENISNFDLESVIKCGKGYEQATKLLKDRINDSLVYLKKSIE